MDDDTRKARRAERDRAWRASNPEKVAAAQRRYYLKNREARLAVSNIRAKKWREDNPERFAANGKRWVQANPDRVAAIKRRYAEAHHDDILRRAEEWRQANLEKHAAAVRRWAEAHPDKVLEIARRSGSKRRALTRSTQVAAITADHLAAKFAFWGDRCWMCGGDWDSVDHVKPLSKGGPHVLANLRPACRSCNSKKKNRWYGVDALRRFLAA